MYLDFLKRKNDYIAASKRADKMGLAAGAGGNISVRLEDSDLMLIKPSGITLGDADESNFVITDFDGTVVEGNMKPTKETLLHGELYKKYSHIKAIVHVHPIHTMIVANIFDRMDLVTKQMKQITDHPIEICKIKNNTIDRAGMDVIHKIFSADTKTPGFLLEEHGLVAVGKTAVDACYIAELLEENAKVFWEMKR